MPLWKPLLLITPAGLVLGMIGGHWAQPVLAERASDATLQAMFQTRAERYGLDPSASKQTADVTYYDGGYSYAPDWAARTDVNWSPPHEDAWSYSYAAAPLPTVAQLDARQAALLADPDKQFAVHRPIDAGNSTETAPGPATDLGEPQAEGGNAATASETRGDEVAAAEPEPRTADGQPAIW
jgi:hypothetical protein